MNLVPSNACVRHRQMRVAQPRGHTLYTCKDLVQASATTREHHTEGNLPDQSTAAVPISLLSLSKRDRQTARSSQWYRCERLGGSEVRASSTAPVPTGQALVPTYFQLHSPASADLWLLRSGSAEAGGGALVKSSP